MADLVLELRTSDADNELVQAMTSTYRTIQQSLKFKKAKERGGVKLNNIVV